ncbi:MAG: divalent-cation tolerance protein CutA [Cyanobacteria bacterium J06621_11]
MSTSPFSIVITTCSNEQEATRITTLLIEKKLAACVQSSEIQSTYHWQGNVETDHEIRLMIKTRSTLFDDISAVIKRESSYDNPEIVAIPITQGSQTYFTWLETETLPQ